MLVPFAACQSPQSRDVLHSLPLPHLRRLLSRLAPAGADDGSAESLSTPHERALAREYGLPTEDGRIPWAAWQVACSGRAAADAGQGGDAGKAGESGAAGDAADAGDGGHPAWAWITPCHWRVGTDHVAMGHPQDLRLDAQQSQALLAAMRPYFEQDGIALAYSAPTLWLARGGLFRNLAAASLDRVAGRVIDPWMPRDEAARGLRRLQQEMQMLLYTHPVNDERTRGGQAPVNSFWVSGTGALPAAPAVAAPAGLQVVDGLREAALRDDWHGWAAAWQHLDATDCARLLGQLAQGTSVKLTLCGERGARTWSGRGSGIWARVASAFDRRPIAHLLEPI